MVRPEPCKQLKRRPRPFVAGIAPCYPAITRVLIVTHLRLIFLASCRPCWCDRQGMRNGMAPIQSIKLVVSYFPSLTTAPSKRFATRSGAPPGGRCPNIQAGRPKMPNPILRVFQQQNGEELALTHFMIGACYAQFREVYTSSSPRYSPQKIAKGNGFRTRGHGALTAEQK